MAFASIVGLFAIAILTSAIEVQLAAANGGIRDAATRLPHSYEVSIKFAARHLCNGAIISPRHVLTAAHCFYQRNGVKYPEPMYKYMSVVSGSNANLLDGGQSHRIKNVSTHRDFRISDVAVVTLDSEIAYSALEQPIELSDVDASDAAPARTSIWTSPADSLQTVEVHLLERAECAERLRKRLAGAEHDGRICGYTRTGRGLCLKNDGSPLTQNGKLIGIASSSEGCENGNPDVYANVRRSLDFVNEAILQNLG